MPFYSELIIKPVRRDEWELVEPLDYLHEPSSRYIIAPAGFQMDLASIPRIFRPLFPVHGLHTRAAVIHDWLYANRGDVPAGSFSRAEADRVFYDAMGELGVNWFKKRAMYAAVRSGGWLAWN